MSLSTGRIDFLVDFLKAETYFVCEVTNVYDTGGIYIKSNIISVEGCSDSDVAYIDNDIADLTNNVVHFNKGFTITGDFSLMLKGSHFEVGSQILRLTSKNETVSVIYRYDTTLKAYYFELNAVYGNILYMITQINPYPDKEISLWVQRINTLFGMEVSI